ncbi:MAG: 3-phosphoshikimate 1-carboxyvinyltransferase [Pseudomonadales bacterium]|jgi:3-phosphoshikimate 1-carboxyvinyltransferase|tara:strand:- start:23897 stop:25177 length:1281 start_codon:yes stop_codon:yes gene_type:complete
MTQKLLPKVNSVEGEINLPGSKSLSNRALLLAALAPGQTTLLNLLRSEDTQRMVEALTQLGVSLTMNDDWSRCVVSGHDGLFQAPNEHKFFLGNAGTAIRPLTSILAMMQGNFIVDGDQYMRERPINHLVEALKQLGASIEYLGEENCPPLRVIGGSIRGGKVEIKGDISSQYLTSLLLALPLAPKDSEVSVIGEQVSKPYLDLTLDIMSKFGVNARHENHQYFTIPGGQSYQSPGTYLIEGDASSASYFFAAAAIAGGTVRVNGIGSNSVQGDIEFLDAIEAMGAVVSRQSDSVEVSGGALKGIDMDLNHIPDAAMTIAAMALFAEGTTIIRNIYNWRVKETDRMFAMATELRKLGATVEAGHDYIVIEPPEKIQSASIDTYGDHRIAMCFSLASLSDAEITINNPEVTAKTFPDYFDVFASICH